MKVSDLYRYVVLGTYGDERVKLYFRFQKVKTDVLKAAKANPVLYFILRVFLKQDKSITDVRCYCKNCGWIGTVLDCEPDVDNDGSLGCPACLCIVDA